MTVRLITLSLRQVLRLQLLTCRSSRSKDLELLVLRQELAVLRRQVPHPKTKREERLVLCLAARPVPSDSPACSPPTRSDAGTRARAEEVGRPTPDQQAKDDLP